MSKRPMSKRPFLHTCKVSVSVFPHCSIGRKLLPLHPCIKKCTIMDAKKDYSHVISGYRNELRLNGKATLSAYCRSVGVSISAVHHWMENYGITTKKIEGSDYPFIVRIACIQHIKRRFIDFARRNIRDAYDDTSYSRKMD